MVLMAWTAWRMMAGLVCSSSVRGDLSGYDSSGGGAMALTSRRRSRRTLSPLCPELPSMARILLQKDHWRRRHIRETEGSESVEGRGEEVRWRVIRRRRITEKERPKVRVWVENGEVAGARLSG
jgi:hypothetical protein